MEKLPSKSTKNRKAQKSPVKHIVQDEPKPNFGKIFMIIDVGSPS